MPDRSAYRLLQQHLDRQPVGFPAVRSGADLKLLERLFDPDEARLALCLSYRPAPTAEIAARAAAFFPGDVVERMLEEMFNKGCIARKEKNGAPCWSVVPLVVGMYEFQSGSPAREFLKDAAAYMQTLTYGRSLLAVHPPQMRTIPVNRALTAEHHVAPYDRVRAIIAVSPGPFVVVDCICRAGARLKGKPCLRTSRPETCLGMGDMAAMAVRRGRGREVSRDEALAVLAQNEEDGLVLQPSGAQAPEFICSCCGCCCGMLVMQKKLPRPVDFWSSGYCAEVAERDCRGCGSCVKRCQVNAVTLSGSGGRARINLKRCIGCGLCVSTCAPRALRLVKKDPPPAVPRDEETLLEEIRKNKKGPWGERLMMLKLMLGLRQRRPPA